MMEVNKSPGNSPYGTNEALLRSEIGFWSELIASSGESMDSTALERMQQALALAEFRLAGLINTSPGKPKEVAGASNVSCIRTRRQMTVRPGQEVKPPKL